MDTRNRSAIQYQVGTYPVMSRAFGVSAVVDSAKIGRCRVGMRVPMIAVICVAALILIAAAIVVRRRKPSAMNTQTVFAEKAGHVSRSRVRPDCRGTSTTPDDFAPDYLPASVAWDRNAKVETAATTTPAIQKEAALSLSNTPACTGNALFTHDLSMPPDMDEIPV